MCDSDLISDHTFSILLIKEFVYNRFVTDLMTEKFRQKKLIFIAKNNEQSQSIETAA